MASDGEYRVDIRELDWLRIRLKIVGFPVAFVNAIRRLVLSDVPTMAVDYAYIHDNTTSVYDEMLAHRLGLVVLDSRAAVKKYKPPEECRDADSSRDDCFVEIGIDVEVDPGERTGRYILASDLYISDPEVKPVYPETPIAYIAPGQRIRLQAFARLGRGREHSKWSPASISVLRYTPRVKYDASKASNECLKCLEAYPSLVKTLSGGGSGVITLDGVRKTSGLRYCAETACRGAIIVEYDPSTLDLEVESTGALRPEEIILLATSELEKKVKRLREAVERVGVEEA